MELNMRTIRVDDEVFRALQRRGKPFIDTPNSVLRRLLRLDKGDSRTGGSGTKAPSRSRRAGVEDWIVDGTRLGTRQVSKVLARVYGEDDPKAVYKTDSPERFLDIHVAEIVRMGKVEAVVKGQVVALQEFVRRYPAVTAAPSSR
jgi:negative regulator of replication initiation